MSGLRIRTFFHNPCRCALRKMPGLRIRTFFAAPARVAKNVRIANSDIFRNPWGGQALVTKKSWKSNLKNRKSNLKSLYIFASAFQMSLRGHRLESPRSTKNYDVSSSRRSFQVWGDFVLRLLGTFLEAATVTVTFISGSRMKLFRCNGFRRFTSRSERT